MNQAVKLDTVSERIHKMQNWLYKEVRFVDIHPYG